MPVEIRELNIRISVSQNQQEQAGDTAGSRQPLPDKDSLISECMEQVAEMLNNKKER